MKSYHVVWEIVVEAKSPKAAAEKCLKIQRDPDSHATVFDVTEPNGNKVCIDLLPDEEGD